MRYKTVLYAIGRLMLLMAGFLVIPVGVAQIYGEHETLFSFLAPAFVTALVGAFFLFRYSNRRDESLGTREGFLLVTVAWLLVSFIGAWPFYLSPHFKTFADAFFESSSGFTTTGASVLNNIEALSHAHLFWRSFIQWIGGMGIIVLAVAILPQLSIGGMQFMKNETPGPTFEQLKPRIKQTALTLWKVYVLFTVVETILLWIFGMSLFDAICHSFTTLSSGGFSTKNVSVESFHNPVIHWIITFFMFMAGVNFVLHYACLKGDFKKVFQDSEWRFYVTLTGLAFLVITIDLVIQSDFSIPSALHLSVFQVFSITTTTGFSTNDFDTWPHLSKGLLFLLMIVGGCAGSTGGGMKQLRLLLLFQRAKQSIMQHLFPKAVIAVKVNKRVIPESVLHGVSSFFLIYVVLFSFATLALLTINIDFITATSAVVACLSNIGPGFEMVGPSQNYSFFPAIIKYLLSFCMIIGRLELLTVLVLFFPIAWRR